LKTQNQQIQGTPSVTLSIKREDLIDRFISGNKYRKLKYNIVQAKLERHNTLLTFGGAFSNHIAAVAAAAKEHGFRSIGIIRGEELRDKYYDNPTLAYATGCGMQLEFISRNDYRLKSTPEFIDKLRIAYGPFYYIPEGGTNALAVKGCEEILIFEDSDFDYICCAVGTGGTVAGIVNSSNENQQVLAFAVLKGDFLQNEIERFATKTNWELVNGYEMGGYARITPELISFINNFYRETGIPLDPLYTGKMMFGVMDLISKRYFPAGAKILAIHTGGLQGISGMNIDLKNKNLPLIEFDV